MDDASLLPRLRRCGGFLLLAIGFRFLCRITGWPLANALLAARPCGPGCSRRLLFPEAPFWRGWKPWPGDLASALRSLLLAGVEGFPRARPRRGGTGGRLENGSGARLTNSGRRIVGVALLVDIMPSPFFLGYAMAIYSANRIVPAFALKWESVEALHGFLGALAGLQFLGLAMALGSSKGKAEELVQGAIVPTVILSAFLAAGALMAGPQVEAARSGIRWASATFSYSLDAARAGLESGDLERSRAELGVCQAIARRDPRVEELESRLSAAELKVKRESLPQRAPDLVQPKDPVAAKDFYLKALAFAEKGDYFSANWYASTAARLDPSYTDARRLAATSWEELHSRGADPTDRERAAFYSRKLEGYGLLRSGDPVGAYRVFKELADAKHADDPDVRRYLAESLTETEKAAFFKDEVDAAISYFPVPDILFRVPFASGAARGFGKATHLDMIAAKDAAWSGGRLVLPRVRISGGGRRDSEGLGQESLRQAHRRQDSPRLRREGEALERL